MAVKVVHSVTTGAPPDPSALVDGPAWDAQHVVTGLAASATTDTTNASNITSGSLPVAQSQAPAGTALPLVDGTATVGTATHWSHEDHIHPTDTSRAPIASPTFTGIVSAPTVHITPASSSLTDAIVTTQNLAGATSSNAVGGIFQFPAANLFYISSDSVDASSPSNDLDGWQFNHTMGSSTLKGARQTLDAIVNFIAPTSSSNTNRNYVAGVFQTNVLSGDGGTGVASSNAQGAFFGANPVVRTTSAATNLIAVTGMEIDVAHSGTCFLREGLSVVSFPGNNGAVIDAAIAIGVAAGAGAVAWNNGILFSTLNGVAQPIAIGGTAIRTDTTNGSYTILNGIDFSNITISGSFLKAPGFSVAGTGSMVSSVGPTVAWPVDCSGNLTASIGNSSSLRLAVGNGLIIIREASVSGDEAVIHIAKATTNSISAIGASFVANSTSPAAGKWSVAYDGTGYSIYNNIGSAALFAVGGIRIFAAA